MPNTNLNKLTTLEQLKLLALRVKSEDEAIVADLGARIEAVAEDVEGLITTGGEANVLEGVKVNGVALDIAEKMVDILVATGSADGTIAVNGVDVAVKGLSDLAFLSKVSENELDDALKAVIAAKATQSDLEALGARVTAIEGAGYQTAAQVSTAIQAAISASGHAHFEKVDAVPTAETAAENVLYLVMNGTTGHYDIYALVSGEVVLIDDTTVDLSAYSTTEQMNAAITAAIEALKIGDYAKASDLSAAVERVAVVEAKFNNYYTKTEIDGMFANYSTTEQMNAAIKVVDDKFAGYTNTEGMNAAIKEVDDKFADYSTTEQMNTTLEGYATDDEAATAASNAVANATATDEEVNAMLTEVFGE